MVPFHEARITRFLGNIATLVYVCFADSDIVHPLSNLASSAARSTELRLSENSKSRICAIIASVLWGIAVTSLHEAPVS
jgi:hypothetical protein